MTELSFILPLELRAVAEDDGRTLEGRIIPYGETISLGGDRESFTRGVFGDVDPSSVVLLWQHDQTAPIGRMTELSETDDGAYGTFRLADTARAREARSLIEDGIVKGLSVGFQADQSKTVKGVRVHTRARLRETSLVTFPAYPTAGVLAVRKETEMDETPTPDMVEEAIPAPLVDLTSLEERIDSFGDQLREVRNEMTNLNVSPARTDDRPGVITLMAQVLDDVAGKKYQERALADVIGTGTGNAEGLVPVSYASEILGILDPVRPFFAAAGTYPFPASGYGVSFPRITQHTQVAKRTGEKTEVASRELTVAPGLYSMEWFAGAVDVSLELISQSDPDVQQVVIGDLLDQYAIVTEDEFVTDVETAATASGDVLDLATWPAFAADVISTSQAIKTATGRPGDRLALTTASWTALVSLLNPSQPAALPGPGAPGFTSEAVDVRGVVAFHSPESTVDVQFNTKALRKSEKPPLTVTANNVALMGRDIGVLGATIFLPLYPAGIVKHAA
jgi:HK97 family phage prohead protease/HK97 family phage major capsid protein